MYKECSSSNQESISFILGVQIVLGMGKYPELPSMIGRSKQATFTFIKNGVWKKINSWSSKCLYRVDKKCS